NLIEAQAQGQEADTPLGAVRIDTPSRGKVTLSLRPEHLCLCAADDEGATAGVGQVVSRECKGHDMTCRVRLGTREYMVQTDYAAPFRVGDRVRLTPRASAAVVDASDANIPVSAE